MKKYVRSLIHRFQKNFSHLRTFALRLFDWLWYPFVTSWNQLGLWHCWRRQWLWRVHCAGWKWDLCMECPYRFVSYFVSFFLNHLIFNGIKGINNACPCIEEIRGTYGRALATLLHSPTARAGSPTKVDPCVPLISTMHGPPLLIPSATTHNKWHCVNIEINKIPEWLHNIFYYTCKL